MDVWKALEGSIWFFGFFGLSHIKADSAKSAGAPRYRLSLWRIIYSTIVLFLLLFVVAPAEIYVGMTLNFATGYPLARIVYLIYFSLSNPFAACLGVICSFWFQKADRDVANDISYAAKALENLIGTAPRIWVVKYLLVCAVYMLLNLGYEFSDYYEIDMFEFSETLLKLIGIMYVAIMSMQFAIYVYILASMCLELKTGLARSLEEVFCVPNPQEVTLGPFGRRGPNKVAFGIKPETTIQLYRVIYQDLFELSLKLNDIFALNNLWIMFNALIITVNETYNSIADFPDSNSEAIMQHIDYFIDFFLMVVIGLLSTVMIIHPCEKARTASADIGRVVNKFLAMSNNSILTTELWRFSALVQQQEIKFSPYGLFVLNGNSILTITGATISYIVILSQVPHNLDPSSLLNEEGNSTQR